MSTRTPLQSLLLGVGVMVVLGGLVCVGAGILDVGGAGLGADDDSATALLGSGAAAVLLGIALVALNRPGSAQRRRPGRSGAGREEAGGPGARRPEVGPPGAGRPEVGRPEVGAHWPEIHPLHRPHGVQECARCGAQVSASAHYCEACGAALG